MEEDAKLYLCVSSPTIKDKPVSEAKLVGMEAMGNVTDAFFSTLQRSRSVLGT